MNRNLLTIEPSILSLANIMRDINPEIERATIDDSRMVLETEKAFLATLDMPGVNMADISIEIEDNKLTITAERHHPFQEQNKIFKKYNYTYTLPKTVDQENINATMDNGVLCLTLPKMDEAKYKKKIQVTNSQKSSLWSNFLNFRKAEHEKEKDVINAQ